MRVRRARRPTSRPESQKTPAEVSSPFLAMEQGWRWVMELSLRPFSCRWMAEPEPVAPRAPPLSRWQRWRVSERWGEPDRQACPSARQVQPLHRFLVASGEQPALEERGVPA